MAIPTAADFEKLGAFYLGRPYDAEARAAGEGSSSTTRRIW
jgi:hypothetical protein